MGQKSTIFILLLLLMGVLFSFDLGHGMAWNFSSAEPLDELDRMILTELRLPRALTALLAGMALSVSGLMMQTLFRNPLAGPYTLGVSGGASLGVALVTMLTVSWLHASASLVVAAVVGSTATLLLVIAVAKRLRSNTSMLIFGMMLASISGAIVNLIQNFSNPDALKLFITWTFGSLSAVGWGEMAVLLPVVLVGLALSLCLIKPMNGLALGENYARGLGISVDRLRVLIVLATGLLAGSITAYCGPIAFVGVAVPHLARGLFGTNNHRITLPASLLLGADMLLLCDILTTISTPLPVSTVSALFGAPVVIWVVIRHRPTP